MEKELLEQIGNFRIYAERDDSPENPFTSWDCNPPTLVFYDRSVTGYAGGKRDDSAVTVYDFLPLVSLKKCREILTDLAGEDDAKRLSKEYGNARDALGEYVIWDAINNPRYWGEAGKYFDLLESLAIAAKIPHYNGQRNGYSQGHCTLVFVALLPATLAAWGNDKKWIKEHGAKSAESTADLYAAWAYGDVYGYTIAEVIPGDEDEDEDEDEDFTGESCWGYYGDDHEKSGLLEDAYGAVERLVKAREEKAVKAREDAEKEAKEALDAACRDIATV
jgi:hypothetical protein